jgi:hypothetical protein
VQLGGIELMLRFIPLCLLTTAVIWVLAGCGGGSQPSDMPTPPVHINVYTSAIVDGKDLSVQIAGTSVSFEFPHNG